MTLAKAYERRGYIKGFLKSFYQSYTEQLKKKSLDINHEEVVYIAIEKLIARGYLLDQITAAVGLPITELHLWVQQRKNH